jgi:3D (Asp-Asp-Asp) domain-containing protein
MILISITLVIFNVIFIASGVTAILRLHTSEDNKEAIPYVLQYISALCAIILNIVYLQHLIDKADSKPPRIKVETLPIEPSFKTIKATYYNATPGQCDKSPLITATGYKINLKKLKNKEIKIVALSRDLLKQYPYGSEVYVHNPVHLRGCWKVEDTMNKRFSNRIDFLVYDKVKVDSVKIL